MKDVVIACYFTGQIDWQRGEYWKPDYGLLIPLISSIMDDTELVIIHDCFDSPPDRPGLRHVKVAPIKHAPGMSRWIHANEYLKGKEDIGRVWICDSTDVEMVNNPFPEMNPRAVYTGDEKDILGNSWMIAQHNEPHLKAFIANSRYLPLLNCGLLGGTYEIVSAVTDKMVAEYNKLLDLSRTQLYPVNLKSDMGIFNYIIRNDYPRHVIHGRQVCSVFKEYDDLTDCLSWWKHK